MKDLYERMKERLFRVKQWLSERKDRIFLFFGLLAVGALSFGGGFIQGKGTETKPLLIEIPSAPEQGSGVRGQGSENPTRDLSSGVVKSGTETASKQGQCAFVGSRNSDKYHLPSSSCAKRIKPENRVCFAAKEDAEKRGYKAGCLK